MCSIAYGLRRPRPKRIRSGYDLVAVFDCLHDMGDPLAGTAYPPIAGRGRNVVDRRDRLPIASKTTSIRSANGVRCVDAAVYACLARPEVGTALGALAGEGAPARRGDRRRFHTGFQRAAATLFTIVFEARRNLASSTGGNS
jgi:hypothetical protein